MNRKPLDNSIHYAENGDSVRTGCGLRITYDMTATRGITWISCECCLESQPYLDALAQGMEDALDLKVSLAGAEWVPNAPTATPNSGCYLWSDSATGKVFVKFSNGVTRELSIA